MIKLSLILTIATCSLCMVACKKKSKTKTAVGGIEILDIKNQFPANDPEKKKKWQTIIEQFYSNILEPKLNGQFLIAKNGEIIFDKVRGFEGYLSDKSKPMTDSTALHLASTSKPFTATAILMLQQQGKLNIEDSVVKYLPKFPYKQMTIKSLLTHRTGLLDYEYNLTNWGYKNDSVMITNDSLLGLLAANKPKLNFPYNTRFLYSNTNYALLALIVEKVSGIKFPKFLQNNIFIPLQMKNTFVFQPKDTARVTKSFYRNGLEYKFNNCDAIYGDKNVYSTAKDLLKWDQALYTEKILTKASKEIAFAGYSNEKPGINNYGLGWRMKEFPNGSKFVFHNGWWHGNKNAFIRLIQDTAVIICLGNNFQDANYATMELSFLFGDYPFGIDPEAKKDTTGAAQKRLIEQLKAKADSLKLHVPKKPIQPSKVPPVPKKDSLPKKVKDTGLIPSNKKEKEKEKLKDKKDSAQ